MFLCGFLQVPNFEVRANATLVFTEAFPLYDPEQSIKNIDEAIQKQLDTVMVSFQIQALVSKSVTHNTLTLSLKEAKYNQNSFDNLNINLTTHLLSSGPP